MAGETIVTVVGTLTADPEIRYTQNGLPVANFTIASTPRHFDKAKNEWVDDDALFLRASIWRDFAENVAASLTKGTRVIATGRLKQRSYEDKEGNKRRSAEVVADNVYFGDSKRDGDSGATGYSHNNYGGSNGGYSAPAGGYAAPVGGSSGFSEIDDEDGDLPF